MNIKIDAMKKLILVCAVLCLTASTASAQMIRFGVKGGLTMLSTDVKGYLAMDDSPLSQFKSKDVGWNLGLMARVNLPLTNLYVQPELIYNHAAYEMVEEDGGSEKLKYGNIELPVLLGFKVLFLRANVGPVFTLGTLNSGNFDVKRPDVGFQAGLGVTIKKITLDVRYHGYFEKKWKELTMDRVQDKLKANDGYWGVSLGYFF